MIKEFEISRAQIIIGAKKNGDRIWYAVKFEDHRVGLFSSNAVKSYWPELIGSETRSSDILYGHVKLLRAWFVICYALKYIKALTPSIVDIRKSRQTHDNAHKPQNENNKNLVFCFY